jgi:ketosteroid isomerase-like protein
MKDSSNVERLKAAYKAWHDTKGEDASVWLGLMEDDFRLVSMGQEAQGLAFAKERNSRQEAVGYLTGLLKEWRMVHWTPETFVCEGDRIAMFGRCAWANRATGKSAACRIAHLWTFRNGKAIELTEVFDSARAAAAATP